MTTQSTESEPEVVDDRRAVLEAAFDQAEATEATEATEITEADPDKPEVPAQVAPTDAPAGANPAPTEVPAALSAPQSWKPAQKAKWAKLDVDIQQEVLRRDRETTQVLNDTTQARQIAQRLSQTVQPYMARIQSLNTDPLTAVQELFKADHLLSTAPKVQRARLMASLISDYGVDLQELDNALAGRPVADPVDSRVEELLQQRLAPIQQFLSQQQLYEQQRQQQAQQQLAHTVETMAQDANYPHFAQVRESMADIVEIMANRGQHITIETAYNRAVAMDPVLGPQFQTKSAAQRQADAAAQVGSRAQRALNASVSVGGAPSGAISGALSGSNRRATIEAAFDAAAGR
jgi:hypothetical protein